MERDYPLWGIAKTGKNLVDVDEELILRGSQVIIPFAMLKAIPDCIRVVSFKSSLVVGMTVHLAYPVDFV